MASFVAVWTLPTGRIAGIVGSACLFYLAWHAKRSQAAGGEGQNLESATETIFGARRLQVSKLLLMSILAGAAIGGTQAYCQFLQLGWSRTSAGSVAVLIAIGASVGGGRGRAGVLAESRDPASTTDRPRF